MLDKDVAHQPLAQDKAHLASEFLQTGLRELRLEFEAYSLELEELAPLAYVRQVRQDFFVIVLLEEVATQ